MQTTRGHLTYCTNIHAGESWPDHFEALKRHFPAIKERFSPDLRMGIGLRLSGQASRELLDPEALRLFKEWLTANRAYVFTMNGFPYGGFHHTRVKEQVHAPDWITQERVSYTLRMFTILKALLPQGMDGGISTSPLSYRHWFTSVDEVRLARQTATLHILSVASELMAIRKASGKLLHLDIEPEPDGLLETGREFIDWFDRELLPAGIPLITKKFQCGILQAEDMLKEHIRLCYDVCHFAIGYESHKEVVRQLSERGIKVGKIQISAALKAEIGVAPDRAALPEGASAPDRAAIRQAFAGYDEPVYLHQVVARKGDGSLLRYSDLPQALADYDHPGVEEWRAHFHVPLFAGNFGVLQSTRQDILQVLELQKNDPFTQHLEIETYTWEVLPPHLKLPLEDSIVRELQWVKDVL
jgi:hypothetical protein